MDIMYYLSVRDILNDVNNSVKSNIDIRTIVYG